MSRTLLARPLFRLPREIQVALAIAYAGVIFWLSSLSGDTFGDRGGGFRYLANLFHAPLFFGLALLVCAAVLERRDRRPVFGWKRAGLGVTISMVYACTDEWHQAAVSGRAADPVDLITDLAGVLAAAVASREVLAGAAVVHALRSLAPFVLLAALSAAFATR